MIKLVHHNLRPFQTFIARADCDIDYCAEACVFRDIPASAQVVRHGSEGTPAVIGGQKLWLNISRDTHPANHPLYITEQKITTVERSTLLKRIQASQPDHIVSLYAVCRCGMVIEILEGLPLADIGTRPAWHRQMYRGNDQSDPWQDMTWLRFLNIMADLSEGIQSLHDRQLVHGDLFPFNAMVTPAGQGIWLDLNDVLPATTVGIATDIWAFLAYTFLPGLHKLKNWQPHLVKHVAEIIAVEKLPKILPALMMTLRQAAREGTATETAVEQDSLAVLTQIFQESGLFLRGDELSDVARLLTLKGSLYFFSAFEWNAKSSFERERWLAAEQARHHLVERELQRTLSLRYRAQISELEAWNSDLEQGKTWLETQYRTWQETAQHQADRIEELQAWVKELEESKAWLEAQNRTWQETAQHQADRIEELQAWVKELEEGKAWLEEQWQAWQKVAKTQEQRIFELEQKQGQQAPLIPPK